ncbi:dihydrolipoyl dehydrogenase family protein [Parvularcula maris]|uniref:FAD-dependent oxidoreductase n=1 Tax=Parvularcula maris TaxID=2965077 RepID=A0A9X2L8L6_9PROT|nr:FAD-dependent oxidoreductase [Parvularcula maris]MCQ8184929.1 FAD-dependent oxidoreductase [Parvularcula maris]
MSDATTSFRETHSEGDIVSKAPSNANTTNSSKKRIKVDACVIGAGSGGLTAAGGLGALGRKVVLVEGGKMGGDCLNYGCVPSKTLIASAKTAHTMRDAARFGITPVEPEVQFLDVIGRVQQVIADLAHHDSEERMKEEFNVDTIRAYARFTGPREVTAGDTVIEAKHFVIATGSSAFVPPIEGLKEAGYLTNESVFEQTFQPRHLIVLGGGPIGMEMAQAHRLLGSKVTVIEKGKIFGKDDPELVAVVRKRLDADGIDILEDFEAKKVAKDGDTFTVTIVHEDGTERTVEGDQLLVAVGRRPNVEGLDLEKAGIEYSPRGIKVDDSLKTTNSRVFAIGDVTGGLQFTHVAGYQGRLAVKNILLKALGGKNKTDHVPWVTYTEPELAHVGLTENQVKERGIKYSVVRAPFHDNDRANAEGETDGLVKVLVGSDGKILGADVVGAHAGEVVQQFALAVANGLKMSAFDKMIAPYPTLGEISKAAADTWSFEKLFTPLNKAAIKALALLD